MKPLPPIIDLRAYLEPMKDQKGKEIVGNYHGYIGLTNYYVTIETTHKDYIFKIKNIIKGNLLHTKHFNNQTDLIEFIRNFELIY